MGSFTGVQQKMFWVFFNEVKNYEVTSAETITVKQTHPPPVFKFLKSLLLAVMKTHHPFHLLCDFAYFDLCVFMHTVEQYGSIYPLGPMH